MTGVDVSKCGSEMSRGENGRVKFAGFNGGHPGTKV